MSAPLCLLGLARPEPPHGSTVRQAVAAARLGAEVSVLLGLHPGDFPRDAQPETAALKAALLAEGVEVVGPIEVGGPTAKDVDAAGRAVEGAAVVLARGSAPAEAVERLLEWTEEGKRCSLLHASPGGDLPRDLLARASVLVAGEREACSVARCPEGETGLKGLGRRLAALGPGRVVVHRGASAGLLFDGERAWEERGTADSEVADAVFVAALAVALAEGLRNQAALKFALTAASLAHVDEQPFDGLPTREAVEARLEATAPR